MDVTVSAIIRTRNRPRFLREALASALAQTRAQTEIVVVEDGGESYSAAIADELSAGSVSVVRNDPGLGVGPATLRGVEASSGELIAFLDDDDLWDPPFLERLSAPLGDDPTLVAAFCRRRITDEDGRPIPSSDPSNWEDDLDWPAARGVVRPFVHEAVVSPVVAVAQSCVLRRDALDWSFLADMTFSWDYETAYRLARTMEGAWYEPDVLTTYRIHGGGMSTDPAVHDDRVAVNRRYLDDDALAAWRAGLRMRLAAQLEARALNFRDAEGLRRGRRDLLEALRIHPRARSLRALPVTLLPFPLADRAFRATRATLGALRRRGTRP